MLALLRALMPRPTVGTESATRPEKAKPQVMVVMMDYEGFVSERGFGYD